MELRPLALLSLQKALLGMVTPDLRAVEVRLEERGVAARFAYDGPVTEEQLEAVSEIETLVLADMPDDVQVTFEAAHVPPPEPVCWYGRSACCYLRKE